MSLADYTLGGAPIPASTGKVSTLGFDYTLGGAPFQWMQDGAGGSPQTITPDTAEATATANDASVSAVVTVTPDTATSVGSAYDATVVPGAVTITPDTASSTGTANDASISASITLTPDAATSTGAAYDATVVPGEATVTPDTATATGSAFDVNIFAQADQAITPDTATATATANDCSITLPPIVVPGGGGEWVGSPFSGYPSRSRKKTQTRKVEKPKRARLDLKARGAFDLFITCGCASSTARAYSPQVQASIDWRARHQADLAAEIEADDMEAMRVLLEIL